MTTAAFTVTGRLDDAFGVTSFSLLQCDEPCVAPEHGMLSIHMDSTLAVPGEH